MKYTSSRDGVERCTIKLEMRFSREQFTELSNKARRYKYKNAKNMLTSILLDDEYLFFRLEEEERLLRFREGDLRVEDNLGGASL